MPKNFKVYQNVRAAVVQKAKAYLMSVQKEVRKIDVVNNQIMELSIYGVSQQTNQLLPNDLFRLLALLEDLVYRTGEPRATTTHSSRGTPGLGVLLAISAASSPKAVGEGL